MIIVFLFLLGLCVGSFWNVLILRTNTGEGVGGRSRCFSCLAKLSWYDLIPVVSFATIRGRCRYCKSRISLQYPLVELATGIIFGAAGYIFFGGYVFITLEAVLHYSLVVSFFSLLLAISVYDLRHKIIPDQWSLALFVLAVLSEVLVWLMGTGSPKEDILAALGAFIFFGGLWFVSRGRWMGFGDAKIAPSLALFLGYPGAIFGVLFAFWAGAAVGVTLLVLGKAHRKTEIPFGPFLALGTLAAFLLISSDAFVLFYKYIAIS